MLSLLGGTALRGRSLYTLYLVVFLSELGVSSSFPLRLLYAQAHHATPTQLGMMAGIFFLSPLVVQLPIGWLIDRWGRVPLLILGVAGHAVIGVLYILFSAPVELILWRGLEGVALAAILPAVNAYIADVTPVEHRAEAFGVLSAAMNGGLLLGPLAGGLVGQFYGFTPAYVLSAGCNALGALLLLGAIHEPARHAAHRDGPQAGAWRELVTLPLLGLYLAAAAGQSVMGVLSALWTIWIRDLGGSYTYIGMNFTVFALPQILLGALAGRLGDRRGRAGMLIGAGLIIGAIYASYGVITNLAAILTLGIIEGIALVVQQPILQSLLTEASPPWARGRVQGIAAMAGAVGGGGAALASFPLYHLSRPVPFLMAGLVVAVGSSIAALSAAALGRRAAALRHETNRAPGAIPTEPPGVLS